MSTPVKLYVYDLSNGMAGQLSLQLMGRQIDGIWHTSVVVFGKEIFYGHGIMITQPGKSHHGSPLRIVDMGETAIDEDTFHEYLTAMRDHYTPDKYHLLDFNCNSFTNDCVGFLTGGNLPPYITSLPSDFLSTPFGAALRPTIDAMFTGPVNGTPPSHPVPSAAPNPTLPTSLLQSVAGQATAGGPSQGSPLSAGPGPAPAPIAATRPIDVAPPSIITNPALFHSLLRTHRAVVTFFTSATCMPCRMVEPMFDDLAKSKSRPSSVGFAKIDLGVGMGSAVGAEYRVRVTPTFMFFLDGSKTHELKGVNVPELKTQIDLLIYQAFPPHAHTSLSLPAIEAISFSPILFTQVPNLDTMLAKLAGFIDGVTSWSGVVTQSQVKQTLTKTILPFLKASTATPPAPQAKSANFGHWPALTTSLVANLGLSELFPLVDMWRIGLLNAEFAAWNATKKVSEGPLRCLIDKAQQTDALPRNYQLMVLRMIANAFSNPVLAREVILGLRQQVTQVLVDGLLHEDATVRTAAASVGFNVAAYLQRMRVDKIQARGEGVGAEENEEWELEIVVAIHGAIEREHNEETVHRLVASLGLLLRLSPYTVQMAELLQALGMGDVLRGRLGTGTWKKDVRTLMSEVADKLV